MSEQGLMTLKDIALRLDLPESSLRKYRDVYPQFIPFVGTGRDRKYRDEAVEVFRAIRELRENAHLSWRDTAAKLAERFPVNAEMVPPAEAEEEPPGEYAEFNARLSAVEDSVRRALALAESQHVVLAAVGDEFIRLKAELQRLKEIREDTQVVRRTLFSNHEYDIKQHRDSQAMAAGILEKVKELQTTLTYVVRFIERALAAPAAAAAVEEKGPKPREKELESADGERARELDEARRRLAALRRENDQLRSRVAELTTPSAVDDATRARRGGPSFFRRRDGEKGKEKKPKALSPEK